MSDKPRILDLSTLVLGHGNHASPDDGFCVMEAVAYFAGEEHSDTPWCASPTVTEFAMQLNDRLDDDERRRLVSYIPRIVGSKGKADDEAKRAFLCADWAIRKVAPIALEATRERGLIERAKRLRELAPITDTDTANAAATAARTAAAAAYDDDAAEAAYAAAAAAAAYAASAAYAYAHTDTANAAAAARAAAAADGATDRQTINDLCFSLLNELIAVTEAKP
jgi:hypothetical protein